MCFRACDVRAADGSTIIMLAICSRCRREAGNWIRRKFCVRCKWWWSVAKLYITYHIYLDGMHGRTDIDVPVAFNLSYIFFVYQHNFCKQIQSIGSHFSHIHVPSYKSHNTTHHTQTHLCLFGFNHMQSWPIFRIEIRHDLLSLQTDGKSAQKKQQTEYILRKFSQTRESIKPIHIMCNVGWSVMYLGVNAHHSVINWDFINQTNGRVCIFIEYR